MSDVGRLAGVSHQTVSRVINGSLHVAPETRERVLWAMRELDYRPNSVARALVTGRSNTLGVVTFDTTLYGPAATLYGVERAAHEAGYFIIAASLKAMDRSSVPEAIERLRRHGVDGILLITPQEQSAEALLHAPAGDTPLVAVEAGPAQAVPVVAIDQVAGAAAATRHLLELGHKTVWHITGPADWLESPSGRRLADDARGRRVRRCPAARRRLERAGRISTSAVTAEQGTRSMACDLSRRTDRGAAGWMRAIAGSGREVPGRLERRRFRSRPGPVVLLAAARDRVGRTSIGWVSRSRRLVRR